MDLNKLKSLTPIKKVVPKKKSQNTEKKKVPHAIKCEVLFYANTWYAIIGNDRYPINITDEDYLSAAYAFSTPDNPNWDWYTIRRFVCTKENVEYLKKYWQLIVPKTKTYVKFENDICKLDIKTINSKNEKLFNRLKPTYYATRRH